MPILEAQIETERAGRYLVQLCRHAAAMGSGGHGPRTHLQGVLSPDGVRVTAEWSDTAGTVTFSPWGQCTLTADLQTLTLRIDADDEERLRQIQDVVVRDLERFSRREPLTISWRRTDRPDDPPIAHAGERGPGTRRSRLVAVGLAAAVAVVIGLHVGLAGSVVASSRWTGMATNIVVALVVLKIILIVLARRRIGRGRARRAPGTKAAGAGT